jgi:hypothetical protein
MAQITLGAKTTLSLSTDLDPMFTDLYGYAKNLVSDASGNVLIGCTTTVAASLTTTSCMVLAGAGNGTIAQYHATGTANGSVYHSYSYNGVQIGSVTQATTSTVAFNTSSDVRLKTNIADAGPASATLMMVRVREFDFLAGSHVAFGVIAQELVQVAPDAVHIGGGDEKTSPWGVDYSKLVPLLVKTAQEQQALIDTLTQRLSAAGIA